MEKESLEGLLENYATSVLELYSNIPQERKLLSLLERLREAQKRGYLLPSDDEALMQVYVSYLRDRGNLLELLNECQSVLLGEEDEKSWELKLSFYAVGLTTALILMRVGRFIIEVADSSPILLEKLDQAEVRYGLARKSFTQLYSSLTSPMNTVAFYEALKFYEVHQQDYLALNASKTFRGMLDLLEEEYQSFEFSKLEAVRKRLKYRWYAFKRRSKSSYAKALFQLFKLSGSQIAEMKQPHLSKSFKNVGEEIFKEMRQGLLPGDVIITRHMDAVSNLFLPGYWPHAAFYVGDSAQRERLGFKNVGDSESFEVIEARKDGVKKRALSETLRVDEFIVLRSSLEKEEMREAVERAISHAGKAYDFSFDFSSADKLACTEVVYRSFEPMGKLGLELIEKAGCWCLPAENLIDQLIGSGVFRVEYCYMSKSSRLLTGVEASDSFLMNRVHDDK